MSIDPYRMGFVEGKGKVLLATRDILPGDDLFSEISLFPTDNPAIFFLPHHMVAVMTNPMGFPLFFMLEKFKKSSTETKNKFLNLYGPMEGSLYEELKEYVGKVSSVYGWSSAETSSFLEVMVIGTHNVIGGDVIQMDVFENISRMSHSCQPNCVMFSASHVATIRSIRPITAGEELTIAYDLREKNPMGIGPPVSNKNIETMSTWQRRKVCFTQKGFTCQCTRCVALGDDTRQYKCSDTACSGHYFVCQSFEKDTPYLLSCSACNQSPTAENEATLLQCEGMLSDVAKSMVPHVKASISTTDAAGAAALRPVLVQLEQLQIPIFHMQASSIIMLRPSLFRAVHDKVKMMQATEDLISVTANFALTLSPCAFLQDAHNKIADALLSFEPEADYQRAKQHLQQAMRIHLLITDARSEPQKRSAQRDAKIVEVLRAVMPPAVQSVTECMFCGETPERAAIKLSKCAACLEVAYCSRGCQKAHWKVHKAVCGK